MSDATLVPDPRTPTPAVTPAPQVVQSGCMLWHAVVQRQQLLQHATRLLPSTAALCEDGKINEALNRTLYTGRAGSEAGSSRLRLT